MSSIYHCTQENNICPKKESCKRYINSGECHTTLFKMACTEDNDYILFIKHEEENKEIKKEET